MTEPKTRAELVAALMGQDRRNVRDRLRDYSGLLRSSTRDLLSAARDRIDELEERVADHYIKEKRMLDLQETRDFLLQLKHTLYAGRDNPDYLAALEFGQELQEFWQMLHERLEEHELQKAEDAKREHEEMKAADDAYYRERYRREPGHPMFRRKK